MKRETIIAIVLGISAGVGIAIFIIFASRSSTSPSTEVIQEDITPTIAIDTEQIDPLLIKEPEDDFVTSAGSITLKGSSQKGSFVVVQTPVEEQVFNNDDGEFSVDLELIPGENNIHVTSYNDKYIDNRTLTVYSISEK